MEQIKVDFAPDFPELTFTSRKKVVTEFYVEILGKKFGAEIFQELLVSIMESMDYDHSEPFISDEEEEVIKALGFRDEHYSWVWERIAKFLNYAGELFSEYEDKEYEEYYLDERTKENELIREMMKQGEFSCLVDSSNNDKSNFIIQWWCRKTDKMYESGAPTLLEALASVLGQAKADPNPWVTEEQCAETAEQCKIQIYIPDPEHPFVPEHLKD